MVWQLEMKENKHWGYQQGWRLAWKAKKKPLARPFWNTFKRFNKTDIFLVWWVMIHDTSDWSDDISNCAVQQQQHAAPLQKLFWLINAYSKEYGGYL